MRIDPKFWSKIKSTAIISSGGFAFYSLFSLYKANEKFYDTWLMPFIHKLDPETSHNVAVVISKHKLLPKSLYRDPDTLKTEVLGLKFNNPIGIAAGFDKQGEAVESLHDIGFGFVEIGSVTPLPQPGNEKPRVFRLNKENAIINRYGFNSEGHDAVFKRILAIKESGQFSGVIGVNLGKNKNSDDPVKDYVQGIEKFGSVADYLVINISSPNTPGLRQWQRKEQLIELLCALLKARNDLSITKKPPLLLKLAPDLTEDERKDIADVIQQSKCKIDGLVISNTTVHRPGINSSKGYEEGGLSGRPLQVLSTKLISDMYHYTNGAGSHSSKLHSQYKKLCKRASKEGAMLLKQGKSSMDVVETVTAILENSPLTNAGLGSTLNWEGKVECDASIMDGSTLKWGGVGAVTGVKNPISLARALCEKQGTALTLGRVPPCLLVGRGAKKWARTAGIKTIVPTKMISERSLKLYQKYKTKVTLLENLAGKIITPLDTVGVVCLDKFGNIAASSSSGGIALKHSGRVGQAAVYGAGVWAENGEESSVAVCSSGCGEHLIRTMLAREISNDLKNSTCPISALHTSFKSKFLDSPYLTGITERLGGVAVLRVNKNGFGDFLWGHSTSTMCLGFMSTSDLSPKSRLSSLSSGQIPGTNIVIEGTSFRTKAQVHETLSSSEDVIVL